MIEEMRPWYDNYCFAEECLKDNNRVFNSDVVLFYLRNYVMYGSSPNINITAPELELKHGYCDFFLLPNMTHYQSNHSYILELKYLSKSDYTEKNAQEQWDEAVEQINGYAVAPRVEALRQGTQLHKIIIQFCGWDMIKMREV